MDAPLPSFRLPEAKEVEVVLIRLADGTVVARAKHEVEATPEAATKQERP